MHDTARTATRLALCTIALAGLLIGARALPDRDAATPPAPPTAEVAWGTVAARLSAGN